MGENLVLFGEDDWGIGSSGGIRIRVGILEVSQCGGSGIEVRVSWGPGRRGVVVVGVMVLRSRSHGSARERERESEEFGGRE